ASPSHDAASSCTVAASPHATTSTVAPCSASRSRQENSPPVAKILVVDDETGIREFLADALADDGHDVTGAADGLEALQRLHERAFDVMITDLRMPGALDGVDLLRKAKADQPELEVIVLTAHGTVDNAVDAMKLGAFDYLQKPLGSPAELRLIVARAIERRRLLSVKDAA